MGDEMNKEKNLAEERLIKYNQDHILSNIKNLDNDQKEELYKQILKIDFEEITNLYNEIKKEKTFEKLKITPIDYIDKEKLDNNEKERLEAIGRKIIENNQYAVVTLAGRSRNKAWI